MKGREPAEPMAGQRPKACESGTVRFPARGGVAGAIEPVPNGARCLRLSSVDPVGVRLEGMRDGEPQHEVRDEAHDDKRQEPNHNLNDQQVLDAVHD